MAEISAYARKQKLQWLLGGAITDPTKRYIGLATGSPTYTAASECGDAGYARQSILFEAASTAADQAMISNSAPMTFGPFNADATVSGYQIWDDDPAGNMWWYNVFDAGTVIAAGDMLGIAAGGIVCSLPAANGIMPYAAKLLLDWMGGGATPTRPTQRWISIATGAPTSVGASDSALSWSGTASFVATMSFSTAVSPAGVVSNAIARTFGVAGGVATVSVSGWNLYDDSVAGANRMLFGTVTAAGTVRGASYVTLAAGGGIKISLL